MHWLWRVTLALAIGCAAQTVVAWWCAVRERIATNPYSSPLQVIRQGVWTAPSDGATPTLALDARAVFGELTAGLAFASAPALAWCERLRGFGVDVLLFGARCTLDGAAAAEWGTRRWEVRCGWPVRSLRASWDFELPVLPEPLSGVVLASIESVGLAPQWSGGAAAPLWMQVEAPAPSQDLLGVRPAPFSPLWFGLVANSVLYAAVLLALMVLRVTLVRRSRRRRRACAECGYDLMELPRCPECGKLASGTPATAAQ